MDVNYYIYMMCKEAQSGTDTTKKNPEATTTSTNISQPTPPKNFERNLDWGGKLIENKINKTFGTNFSGTKNWDRAILSGLGGAAIGGLFGGWQGALGGGLAAGGLGYFTGKDINSLGKNWESWQKKPTDLKALNSLYTGYLENIKRYGRKGALEASELTPEQIEYAAKYWDPGLETAGEKFITQEDSDWTTNEHNWLNNVFEPQGLVQSKNGSPLGTPETDLGAYFNNWRSRDGVGGYSSRDQIYDVPELQDPKTNEYIQDPERAIRIKHHILTRGGL